jgi:hypothetical protein
LTPQAPVLSRFLSLQNTGAFLFYSNLTIPRLGRPHASLATALTIALAGDLSEAIAAM